LALVKRSNLHSHATGLATSASTRAHPSSWSLNHIVSKRIVLPIMSTIIADLGQVNEARNPLVHDHPEPLKIAILGADIEGLAAAIAFFRQGHTVTVSSVSPSPNCAQMLIQVSSMNNPTVTKTRVRF